MKKKSRLSLRRARRTGGVICIFALAAGLTFGWGLLNGWYWALAIPVAAGVFTALGLSFWVGYTINTVRGIPPEADHYAGRPARLIALSICVASIAMGLVFLYGVAIESYWALAFPVGVAVLSLSSMVFWIGWAIVMQRTTVSEPEMAPAGETAEGGEVPLDAHP
ncbi:MAG: hypothetical protein V3S64_14935 [bacterium]